MKNFLLRADRVVLTLYLISVTCSIAGMETFSGLSVLVLLLTIGLRKKLGLDIPPWRTNLDIPLLGFWIWVGICLFIIPEVNPEHRLDVWGSLRWIGLFYVIRISMIRNFKYLQQLETYALGWLLFISVFGVIQFQTGWDPIHSTGFKLDENFWRTRGFFGSVMSFSYVFGIIYFFVIARTLLSPRIFSKENLLPCLTSVFMTWALLGTYTRGLWFAMLIGLSFVLFVINRKWLITLAVSSLVAGATFFTISQNVQTRFKSFTDFSAENESNFERLNLWRANVEIFKSSPIIGVGFRQNASYVESIYSKLGIESDFHSHAHNNFLSILGGTGIIGLTLFLWFNFVALKTARYTYRNAPREQFFKRVVGLGAYGALIGYHVGGLTESHFYDGETMHAYLTTLGLLYAAKNETST